MDIVGWIRRIFGGGAAQEPSAAVASAEDRGAEVAGLNFKSAVDAHMKWKIRLESYINGTSQEDLKVEVVSRDDQCPLGKWIYGRGGGEFGYSETFFDMKAHHAHFHRCAGEVLAAAQAGAKQKAITLLHYGDYTRASERVKKLLARLFVLVSDGKTAIDAHVRWKERLHDYVAGKGTEALSADVVARDDLCTLGRWLSNEGRTRYAGSPAFDTVHRAHAHFHRCAGAVVQLAAAGRREDALRALENGEYAQASDELTARLVDLFAPRQG